MTMTENGISTTTAPGQEQYEMYPNPYKKRGKLCLYDYRHTDGTLFSCVDKSLEDCRSKRDTWLGSRTA